MGLQSLDKLNELLDLLVPTTGTPGDLSGALKHIAQVAQTFFAADSCVIFAINPITGQFIPPLTVAGTLFEENNVPYDRPGLEDLAQQVLKRGVLLVEDLEIMPTYQSMFRHSEDLRSFAALALQIRHRQKLLGVLYLNFRHQQEFSPADHKLLQIFADQASFILQETWLLLRYQEVARIGQEINRELATNDILFEKLQKYLPAILDTTYALLLAVHQPQTNTFDMYLQEEGHTVLQVNRPPEGACQYVLKTQQTLFIECLSNEAEHLPFQRVEIITETGPKESLLFVPLQLRDVSLGVLSIQHPRPYAYNQEDLSILELLASHIALALHNMRLYNSLYQLNETGQILTLQLDSEQALQATVDKIRNATRADIVVLYPYEPTLQRFVLSPHFSGPLLDSATPFLHPDQPDDVISRIVRHEEPIFAKQNTALYTELYGDIFTLEGRFGEHENISSTAALPLRVGDELVGVLFVNFIQPQRFDATQKLFIEGLAHYAAIVIKNARLFGTLIQRRLRELEILQNIDRELSRNLELASVLDTILKLAVEQVPVEGASIFLYNSRTQTLESAAASGLRAESRPLIIPLEETKGITRWVLEQKKPARVDNVYTDPLWRDLYILTVADTISELDVPLLDGDEVVGVLNFESTREGAFHQEDEDFLLTLAGQAVLAVKKAQAYEREKRLAAEGQVLNQISKEITSHLDHVHVFDLILEKALDLTDSPMGNLMLYDSRRKDLWLAAERGVAEDKKGRRQSLDEGIVGYAARNKQLLNVDLTRPPWNEIYLEFFPGALSELAVPMLEGNEIRGVLNVESPIPNNFSESDQRLVQGLADLAVVALQNAERYRKAEREAQRFALLYQAGQELSKISDLTQLEQMYDIILQIAEKYCNGLMAIRRYDPETQELITIRTSHHQFSPPFPRMRLDECVDGQVAREQRTIAVYDTNQPPPEVVPAKLANLTVRSLIITPTKFKERYYGNLSLSHQEAGYFQDTDVLFLEGLTQQLAITIYRLETAQERKALEQRAQSAEIMSSIGHSAFALTHRLDNDLGLVESYVSDIREALKKQGTTELFVSGKLDKIARAARTVLSLSRVLKQGFTNSRATEELAGEPVITPPEKLLEAVQAQAAQQLPPDIQLALETTDDVAEVCVVPDLITDVLRNLVINAIEAMPEGGKIILRAHNAGRSVAIEVADTGPGIPLEKQSKIFDLFYSTKNSSGFGLWSARRNALFNRGDLTVQSQPGQGTTFTLLLPGIDRT